jgi:hypothetical protein
LIGELTANCGSIVYEADCLAAVRRAASAASGMSESARADLVSRLREIVARNPAQAARIREVAAAAGVVIGP